MLASFRFLRYLLAVLVVTVICTPTVMGRPVRIWSEEELFEQADLVVLVKAAGTKDVPVIRETPPKPEDWIEVETTFDVQSVLKGKPAKKPLPVRHKRYHDKEGEVIVIDGPSFVEFSAKAPKQYLAFLKATEIDSEIAYYEPLTGQYDPDGSFLQIERYHISKERAKPADAPAAETTDTPAAAKPSVKDGASGIGVAVQADDRTIVAVDDAGNTIWKADVIAVAGAPGKSAPIVRYVAVKGEELIVVYGKHHQATFAIKTGKLLSTASD